MKVILTIFLSLLLNNLNAQTDGVIIKLDTVYSGMDTHYLGQINDLIQRGYSKNNNGRWLNNAGDETFIAVAALARPQNGHSHFFDRIKLEFQNYSELKGSGSVIFTVDHRGEISDVYCSPKGNASIQNSLLKILEAEPKWERGIWSGPLVNAVYKLTVFAKR